MVATPTQILVIVLALFLCSVSAYAVPPIAAEFYGNVTRNNISVEAGRNLTAYDPNNVFCGRFVLQTRGRFGLLSCRGDDTSTSNDEGPTAGEVVRFYYNRTLTAVYAQYLVNSTWHEGEFRFLKLRVLYCGDGFCDPPENCSACSKDCGRCKFCGNGFCEAEVGETCLNCRQDCGMCPSGGGGGGAGGAGGAGAGAGGAGQGGEMGQAVQLPAEVTLCLEQWACTKWGNCSVAGMQYRTCEDLNKCGTLKKRPDLAQTCEYISTCYDRIQNCHLMPDGSELCEQGVDCGPPCMPCPSCYDGIQNQAETGVDCGGPCQPCPSCFDGIQDCQKTGNLSLCEEAVDCGGPCPPCKQRPVAPEKPAFVGCGDGICAPDEQCTCPADCNRFPVRAFSRLFALLLVIILAMQIALTFRRKDGRIKKPAYNRRVRQLYLAAAFVLFVLVVGSLYLYWFCSCPSTCKKFLYLPILLILLVAMSALYIAHKLRYDEKSALRKLQAMTTTHEKMLSKLLASEGILLVDMESEAAKYITDLAADSNYQPLFEALPNLGQLPGMIKTITGLRERYERQRIQDFILLRKLRQEENELAALLDSVIGNSMITDSSDEELKLLKQHLDTLHRYYVEKKKSLAEVDALLEQYKSPS